MAGNTKRNLIALGVDCQLVTNPNWKSIIKARYVDKKTNHHHLRVDTPHNIERIQNIESVDFSGFDCIVVSDYVKGFLNDEDLLYISKQR